MNTITEMENQNKKTESSYFRDRIATVDSQGQRNWVYAKKPKGKLFNWRKIVALVLLTFFFIAPFLKISGDQLLLFNILQRKFIIFGVIFYPQDVHLILLAFITLLVFIVLFTVIFGRIFCGWICPQTIFMEFVFRQIEWWIEGTPAKQKKLNSAPWNVEKVWKKSLKHFIFFSIAFITANNFLAYLIGKDQLFMHIADGPIAHLGTITSLVIFSGLFYFVFAFFREQVCAIACPYGRLQGVMTDKKTIVVAYDYKRGEPRGPLKLAREKGYGDCIACKACVVVCPAGIDIRNGTQMECINCTACIDECDTVMDRIGKPKGLIRYDSEEGIETGKHSIFNARSIAYSVVLLLLLSFVGSLFAIRGDFEVTILRARGSLFQEYGADSISNIYDFNIANKIRKPVTVDFKLESHDGSIRLLGEQIVVQKGEVGKGSFLVVIAKSDMQNSKIPIVIGLYANGEKVEDYDSSFIGPDSLD